MTRLYIFIASIALTASLSGCSGDGTPWLRSGGMADRVGNFATVRLGKGQDDTGAMTPLKRGSDDDEGYFFGTDDAQGGEQESGKKKHRRRHRHKNGDNPLFEDSQTYQGEGQPYRDNHYQGGGPDDQGHGYDRIRLPESIPAGTAGNALNYSQVLDAQSRQGQSVPITVTANVFRLLPDDRRGSPHERFLIQLPNGSTVLIAHNINLAAYVPLAEGDLVTICGEFIWNQKGGVVHYTHRPTNVRHKGGYIDFNGKRYW
jgi:Protein of unknown function (DUF3465).